MSCSSNRTGRCYGTDDSWEVGLFLFAWEEVLDDVHSNHHRVDYDDVLECGFSTPGDPLAKVVDGHGCPWGVGGTAESDVGKPLGGENHGNSEGGPRGSLVERLG